MQEKLKSCCGALIRWSYKKDRDAKKEIVLKIDRLKQEQEDGGLHNATTIKDNKSCDYYLSKKYQMETSD